uniref:Uncharacterized protein n=2 Tax=Vibrionaceae TaxID=641 RepID=A0A0H4A0U1_VIBSP|nr:hypothetical protein [Enterovibrio norvegicus]AKN39804.1 hypothetical protein [Vibrio splendidus]
MNLNKNKAKTFTYSEAVKTVLIGLGKPKIAEPTRRFIDKLSSYADKPYSLKSLNSVDCRQRDSQRRVRERMIRVLNTIITYVDWASFRLGVAKPKELDPVKHSSMRKRYLAIYGEEIPESTWFRYIDKLIRAGYLSSQAMDLLDKEEGKIRGVAGYKWLTMKLFKELGFKSGWLDMQRQSALCRLGTAGLSNLWPVYASKLSKQKRADAIDLETYQTDTNKGLFDTEWCRDPLDGCLTH